MTHFSLFRLTDVERFMYIQRELAFELWAIAPPLLVTLAGYLGSLRAFSRRTP
jgi:hypothetical protein